MALPVQSLVTVCQENFDRYSKISMPMTLSQIKADLALRAVGQQQALSVPQSEVDDEVLVLQACVTVCDLACNHG